MHKLISRNIYIYTNRQNVNVSNYYGDQKASQYWHLRHLMLKSSSCIMCFIRGHLIVYMTWGGGGTNSLLKMYPHGNQTLKAVVDIVFRDCSSEGYLMYMYTI